ncbi:hypothetical protein [Heliothis virescens ascovirus 3e]|uniref:Uncharacterized protein n=1 Tax=Heliothis virescens ascovirus 3e TaxID=260797 RepID=A4KXC0_HVAVE|nr:hypothetical protein HVAV3e_gp064 [Heliothis virescens ascovirus 3e]ABO37251.1 hypothetical protein [Heliothis virescens ascovirus 3e]
MCTVYTNIHHGRKDSRALLRNLSDQRTLWIDHDSNSRIRWSRYCLGTISTLNHLQNCCQAFRLSPDNGYRYRLSYVVPYISMRRCDIDSFESPYTIVQIPVLASLLVYHYHHRRAVRLFVTVGTDRLSVEYRILHTYRLFSLCQCRCMVAVSRFQVRIDVYRLHSELWTWCTSN